MSYSIDEKGYQTKQSKDPLALLREATLKDAYKIWRERPSWKDIRDGKIKLKIAIIGTITAVSLLLNYCYEGSILNALLFSILVIIAFIFLFYEKVFFIFAGTKLFGIKRLDIFQDIDFRMKDIDSDILYIFNRKDHFISGLKIFKIDIIPDNIQANVRTFLSSLDRVGVPYTYQIIQTSNIQLVENSARLLDNEDKVKLRSRILNSNSSFNVSLYLAVSYFSKSLFFSNGVREIQEMLDHYGINLKGAFTSNFMHHSLKKLKGLRLIDALYSIFFRTEIKPRVDEDSYLKNKSESKCLLIVLRLVFLVILFSLWTYFAQKIEIIWGFFLIFELFFIPSIIFIFWREFFSYFTNIRIFDQYLKLNLFRDYTFFTRAGNPESIYVWNNRKNLLIGFKVFSIKRIHESAYCDQDKFFRSIAPSKLSFSYTTLNGPISYKDLEKEYMDFLTEKAANYLLRHSKNKIKHINWLSMRAGIWRHMFLISASNYLYARNLSAQTIDELEECLQEDFNNLFYNFQQNYTDYEPMQLTDNLLISGLQTIIFKNKYNRLEGTYLPWSLIQGQALSIINKIPRDLKKGVMAQIAAEFNTPINLINDITIGKTINTEFMEEEVPFGFLEQQVRNLIICGGNQFERDDIVIKIVSELVKKRIPSIIFDIEGKYSKLISHFENTQYRDDFYYFKLGRSFLINLNKSDIKSDIRNFEYLEYFVDVCGLTYKLKMERLLAIKNLLRKNPDLDISAMRLDLETKKPYERNFVQEFFISLMDNFSQQTKKNITAMNIPEDSINSKDFLTNARTVIIDLSVLQRPETIFATFIIISKLICYIKQLKNYQPKLLVIPDVEVFFERKYLMDKPYKINEFLNPLIKKGFGFLFLIDEIHQIHKTLFNFINNFLVLESKDFHDVVLLKDLLNLQEIKGQGYYSSMRKNTYQIDYLKQLKKFNALIARNDFQQPFPVKIYAELLSEVSIPSYDRLSVYMRKFGYDFQKTEEQILKMTEKTIFEKDFNLYLNLLDDIIEFLRALKQGDRIGNLHEKNIKEELYKSIHEKLSDKNYTKKQIDKIRNDIFKILKEHNYLVETHHKKASGGESIGTTYSVGKKFLTALTNGFKHQSIYNKGKDLSIIEDENFKGKAGGIFPTESEMVEYFVPSSQGGQNSIQSNGIITPEDIKSNVDFKKVVNSFLISEIIRLEDKLNSRSFIDVIKSIRKIFEKFLHKLRFPDYNSPEDFELTQEGLISIIDYIADNKILKYSRQDLYNLSSKINIREIRRDLLEEKAGELYELLYNFALELRSYS